MSELDVEYKDILTTLKQMIKAKGLKYKQISELSKIPESSLKKIFSGRDCSLKTMLEICQAVEIRFQDVLDMKEEETPEAFEFNEEQASYFADYIDCYKFFIRIFRGTPMKEVMADLNINENLKSRYLRELEDINLIERHAGNQIKFIPNGSIKIHEDSKLYSKIVESLAKNFVTELPKIKDDPKTKVHQVGSVKVTETTLKDFIRKISDVYDEFDLKLQKERKYLPQDTLVPITYFIGIGKYDSIGK